MDTLWMDCLNELYIKGIKEGKESIAFDDVDKLVIEKSKVIEKYEVVKEGSQDATE